MLDWINHYRLAAVFTFILSGLCGPAVAQPVAQWFEDFKRSASDAELYRFLYNLPKGADLHNHLSGSNRSEWWYELAIDSAKNGGYRYYTKVKINNCKIGANQFGVAPYLLLFTNKQEQNYQALPECERSEYKLLSDLTDVEKQNWLNSIRLDKPHEGRDEFFQTHWQRLGDLARNPHIAAEMMVKNMVAFGHEGIVYIEFQHGLLGYVDAELKPIPPDSVADIYRRRLAAKDAQNSGVQVRLQSAILRFAPNAEDTLRTIYRLVDRHRDLYVGINMVGREDNDKGYPLRFLSVLRELRQQTPAINLAIHGGEVDEPNEHVRDTLLLGAKRIGHGLNLITDPDTLLLMRSSEYLVEINLVSNLLLEYVSSYDQHPFPEYLRTGIPVALSTDDRGMWDSNMTDEYFTAVKHFNLSWEELIALGENSLTYSFLGNQEKQALLTQYQKRVEKFAKRYQSRGLNSSFENPVAYGFACRQFKLCDF